MGYIIEELRAGLAAQGENIFYSLSFVEQRNFLQNTQDKLCLERKNKGFEVCDNNCPHIGSLLCDFCNLFDEKTLQGTIQRLNSGEIPSDIGLVF